MSQETDADYHLEPMRERMVAAPWHTALHYEDESPDPTEAKEMMAAYPDYNVTDTDEDSFFIRVDSIQIDAEGEAAATSVLWDVRELAQFCRQTLALIQADRAIERAVLAESGEDDETDDDADDDADDENENEDEDEDENEDENEDDENEDDENEDEAPED